MSVHCLCNAIVHISKAFGLFLKVARTLSTAIGASRRNYLRNVFSVMGATVCYDHLLFNVAYSVINSFLDRNGSL